MRDAMIEAMRAALDRSLAWDVEGDVRAGELTREEQCKVVAAQIAALEAMGAVVVLGGRNPNTCAANAP
jgi:acyl-CoA reductase-like NAD-dependent aldehyde dehydrogenase